MKNLIVIAMIMFMTGCAIPKKSGTGQSQETFTVTLTPQELADAFEYRDNKIDAKLDKVRKDFETIVKKIEYLRSKIAKQVEDCLCPGEMK